ncbi:MAG: hypothetical protein HYZ65_11790 [Burkholderiales bacterium]|nr:hypothetical protein [Burkholderiales bacterium]
MKNTDSLADTWLKKRGLNVHTFSTTRIEIVRAQMVAKLLLSDYGKYLSTDQIEALHEFQRTAANGKKVVKITDGVCFKIMNMMTAVNRKIFMQHRKLAKRSNRPVAQ